MKSLSRVGVGLSVIFGCLLLALFAELYYLLWWKKRLLVSANGSSIEQSHPNTSSSVSDFDPKSFSDSLPQQQGDNNLDNLLDSDKELFRFKPPEQDRAVAERQGTELYKIVGPPRLLFTIVEETKEDLESDDGKSGTAKVKRSLSDYLAAVESQTPYLTPVTSPSLFTPPVTPNGTGMGKHRPNGGVRPQSGFYPCLFESCSDAEFNRKRCSPPPTFKFLQDAEEKLRRKSMESGRVWEINGDQPLPSSLRLGATAEQLISINTTK